ncbi:hypothetical protein ABBQ38_012944 [Trebouxia sp. C0009 RCD-2024]
MLIEVLLQAPNLLDELPPAARKSLSATCRSLRTHFRAQATIITVSDPRDVSKIRCTAWPQLMAVQCSAAVKEFKSQLLSEWEFMMQIRIVRLSPTSTLTALLIGAAQQHHTPLGELSSKHYATLSALLAKHTPGGMGVTLQGPLVDCKVLQCLTDQHGPNLNNIHTCDSPRLGLERPSFMVVTNSLRSVAIKDSCLNAAMPLWLGSALPQLESLCLIGNQLDHDALSAISQATWSRLDHLNMSSSMLGLTGMKHLVSWSLPSLAVLSLDHTGIDAPAARCLAQGCWPALYMLDLEGNNIGASGVSHLVRGNWPLLTRLVLSDPGLDGEAFLYLGIAGMDASSDDFFKFPKDGTMVYTSNLPQFPSLQVYVCDM